MPPLRLEHEASTPLSRHVTKEWLQGESLGYKESTMRSVRRARDIVRSYRLTIDDIVKLTPKFWNLHIDPYVHLDAAAGSLITVQVNIVAGTLARYARDRPTLLPLVRQLLNYNVTGSFCLSEVDHGLDAANLETTATMLPNGDLDLNTPHQGAAKVLCTTSPCGIPGVAIVFAKLIIAETDHGVRAFVVHLHDGKTMYRGITTRLLPPREGSTPVNYCHTTFDHVILPGNALLGSLDKDISRSSFLRIVERVRIGALATASMAIPCLEISPFIAARYSQRRTVADPAGCRVPIISFRTQHGPILTALAQGFVLRELWKVCTAAFSEGKYERQVLHALSTVFKVTTTQHAQVANLSLSERCGAQGLFAFNQISLEHANFRGATIAEGDNLVTSIRLASELLLERYELPASTHPSSLLAQHELGLLEEHRNMLYHTGHHRSAEFNRLFLPVCEKIVSAIGHRMAYDAALDAGLDPTITDLYFTSVVGLDSAWYTERGGYSRAAQAAAEDRALCAALPLLETWLEVIYPRIEGYVTAPIVSKRSWQAFVETLEAFPDTTKSHEGTGLLRSRL